MAVGGRDVGGLVGPHEDLFIAVGDLGHALDDDPVLVAVVVHLQAQAGAGFHLDALDLVARAFAQDGVGAPGARHGTVQLGGLVLASFQFLHHLLHLLGLVGGSHQQGVGGVDDEQVLQADGGHQAVFAVVDIHVVTVDEDGLAGAAVALVIGRREAAHCIP